MDEFIIEHKGKRYALDLNYRPPTNSCLQCHHFDRAWKTITDYEGYEVVVQNGCRIEQYTECHKGGPGSLWKAREES